MTLSDLSLNVVPTMPMCSSVCIANVLVKYGTTFHFIGSFGTSTCKLKPHLLVCLLSIFFGLYYKSDFVMTGWWYCAKIQPVWEIDLLSDSDCLFDRWQQWDGGWTANHCWRAPTSWRAFSWRVHFSRWRQRSVRHGWRAFASRWTTAPTR